MAGGEGTRLRPLTSNQPKPMVPILNRPVMEYIVELVKGHGITDIVSTLQFLPQLIKYYFGDGSEYGVDLSYVVEEHPLGTAGSVKNAEHHLDETFIVISGDALTDIDLTKVVEYHREKGAMATIVLKSVENPLEFGVVITDENGHIQRFLEKPGWGEVFSDQINTGIYVLQPEVFRYVPEDTQYDFSHDVFPALLADGQPIYGYKADGYWCDIGNHGQYMQAQMDMLDGKTNLKIAGIRMKEDVWVGDGASINPSANVSGKVVIGQNAKIEAGAQIREYSIIGHNVVIKAEAHTHRSVVWENSYVGSKSTIHSAIIGKNCDIKPGARVEQGCVIGDECSIGANAVVNHDVKIYPFKTVDAGATVNKSIIWEPKGVRNLFGRHGVKGLVNVDMTAELALHLAMAYGTSLKKDSHIVTSRDPNRAARMIKRAVIAGLNATGIHTRDLRVAPAAVNRFTTRDTRCEGGVHICVSPFDPQSVEIHFFDSQGIDVGEPVQRNIEKYYFREDFRRAFFNEIGEIIFPPRAAEFYATGLLRSVDRAKIRERGFKVIMDYGYGTASLVMPQIAGKLGCDLVALNAFTDEDHSTLTTEEFELSMQQLSRTVGVFKADFGILIDSAGEKVYIIDEKGRRISSNTCLLAMIDLVGRTEKRKGKIAVPLTVSSVAEEIAERHGRKIVRTKLARSALMGAATRRDVAFVGNQSGGYVFPKFLPAYDGLMSFAKLLEMLAVLGEPLSHVIDELPPIHTAVKKAFCPWDLKGLVMRRMVEYAQGRRTELTDGVKIYDGDRWALILPDPEEPIFRVYAEGPNDDTALEEVERHIEMIREITGAQ